MARAHTASDALCVALREQPVFERVAGQVAGGGPMGFFRPRLELGAVSREVETLGVTPEYFPTLGLSPLGRDFTEQDDRLQAPPVLILSHRLWQEGFGGRSDLIGSTIDTSQGPVQVVGVAPPGFNGARRGEQVDAWVPRRTVARLGPMARAFDLSPTTPEALIGPSVHDPTMVVLARLREGLTPLNAEQAIAGGLGPERVIVRPLGTVYGTPDLTTLTFDAARSGPIVAVTSALVLIAGCTTLAALVLVHYERRRRELVIRLALGSSQMRLAARLTGELGILAFAGAAGAMLVAHWSLALLPALTLPGGVDLSRLDLRIDMAVVVVALAVSLVAMAAAGLVPVARFTRVSLAADLAASAQTTAASLLRLRRALLAVHSAAAIVLVVCAGLFVQTMVYGLNRGVGFNVDRTIFLSLQPNLFSFVDANGSQEHMGGYKRAAYERLRSGLEALPDVKAVVHGAAPIRPDQPDSFPASTSIRLPADGLEWKLPVRMSRGGPGYAQALGLPLLAGRWLEPWDMSPARVLVTRSLAETLWPGESSLGRILEMRGTGRVEIVGIVPDFAQGSIRNGVRNGIIGIDAVNITAIDPLRFYLTVATRTRADTLVREVRRVADSAFPGSISLAVDSGRDLVTRDLGRARLGAWFFSGFGFIVLGLALASVFGLAAYVAESRRREMGLRLALGATSRDLMRQTVATCLWPVAVGAVAGVWLAALLAESVSSLLHGVGRVDPVTYAGAVLLMLCGSAAAGWLAALRIRHVQPADVLRVE